VTDTDVKKLLARAKKQRDRTQYELSTVMLVPHKVDVATVWVPEESMLETTLRLTAKLGAPRDNTVHTVRQLNDKGVRAYCYLSRTVTYAVEEEFFLELLFMGRIHQFCETRVPGLASPFGKAKPFDVLSTGYSVDDLDRECRENPDHLLGRFLSEDGVNNYESAYLGTQGIHPYLNPRKVVN